MIGAIPYFAVCVEALSLRATIGAAAPLAQLPPAETNRILFGALDEPCRCQRLQDFEARLVERDFQKQMLAWGFRSCQSKIGYL
jgi:hypothetical protein